MSCFIINAVDLSCSMAVFVLSICYETPIKYGMDNHHYQLFFHKLFTNIDVCVCVFVVVVPIKCIKVLLITDTGFYVTFYLCLTAIVRNYNVYLLLNILHRINSKKNHQTIFSTLNLFPYFTI